MSMARTRSILLAASLFVPRLIDAQPMAEPQSEARPIDGSAEEVAGEVQTQQRLEFARERLELDTAQQRELRALMFDVGSRMQEIDGGSQADRLREVEALQREFRARLGGVLTTGQMAEWDRMGDELRAQAREYWPSATPVQYTPENPLLETLATHLGISTTQAGRGVGAVLAMARGFLTEQDYDVIAAAVPDAQQLAEAAKAEGVVTRPIDDKDDLARVFEQIGIPSDAQVKFVPVMRAWLVYQGAPDAGDLVSRVM